MTMVIYQALKSCGVNGINSNPNTVPPGDFNEETYFEKTSETATSDTP